MHLYESTWHLPDGQPGPYTCNCGATYEVYSTTWPAPDPGKLTCNVCGSLIIEWNGCRTWSAKLVLGSGAAGVPPV
ncbi:MAG: hypothetical protein L0323_05270 [Planctomycetes bacterium]|nr:hypothetical protein [Planctomycetota bacterium]